MLPFEKMHQNVVQIAPESVTITASHALNFLCDILNIQIDSIKFTLAHKRRLLLCPLVKISFISSYGHSLGSCDLTPEGQYTELRLARSTLLMIELK